MSLSPHSLFLLATLSLAAAPAREDVELRWRGKVGDVQRHRISATQDMAMGTTEYQLVVRQEVKAVAPSGVGSVELRYEAFKIHVTGMMAMDFDSTLTGEAAKANAADASAQFAGMAAATVKLEIEPSGIVAKIEGLSEARDKAFGAAHTGMPGVGAILRGMFSDESLKRMVEVNAFPSEKVAVGASWQRTQEVKAEPLGTLTFKSENKLTALETHEQKNCARIEVNGEISLTPGPSAGMEFTLDDSDYVGTALVALDSGYLLELSTKSVLDLTLSMVGNSQQMTVKTAQHVVALAKDAPAFE